MGAPTWVQRSHEAPSAPHRLSVFQFGADAGPDNLGTARRVQASLRGVPNVMCFCVWCFMHQTQLLLKSMLAVLDAHKGAEFTLPTSYFASVATVSNLRRSPGISTRLRKTCAELFSEEISSAAFRKAPGRCLRGRWASIDGVEEPFGLEAITWGRQ